MLNLVIVGTTALDNIKTPFGEVKNALGGSAVYAALAASFFCKTGITSIYGKDLEEEKLKLLSKRGIDLQGMIKGEKTFRWSGLYEYDMNEAKTLKTELNSLLEFKPVLPNNYKKADYVFLANIDPDHQLSVISQTKKSAFILIDTMNYWINHKKEQLLKVIKKATAVVLSEDEARQLFKTANLIQAGKQIINLGPEYVIIKKGEHGALLFSYQGFFSAPGYPLEELKDPTGAGDSFGGAFIGYLAQSANRRTKKFDEKNIRRAVIYGSCAASFCAESFGTDYIRKTKLSDIKERYHVFSEIRKF